MAPFDLAKVRSVSGAALAPQIAVTLPAGKFGGASGARLEYANPDPTRLAVSYRVWLPADFQPVLGGKLGFGANGDEFCVRNMWRRVDKTDPSRVGAEIYVHGPEQIDPAYPNLPGFKRSDSSGDSLFQYYFWLKKGAWNTVSLACTLNDPGVANGVIDCTINGYRAIYNKYTFRTTEATQITSALFQSFYGGSAASWAPTADQELVFDRIDIS